MIPENQHSSIITQNFPDPITSIKLIKDGWANIVYEINKEWIFRFSREESDQRQLEVEKVLLKKFSQISPLNVPTFQYEGEGWVGYKKIVGEPMTGELLKAQTDDVQKYVHKQLGEFFSALHSQTLSHAHFTSHPFGGKNFWKDLWPVVETYFETKTKTTIQEYFKKNLPLLEGVSTVPCHADLGSNHLLFDKESKKLNGVIDFGDIRLYDPAYDFNGMLRHHGEEALGSILSHYSRPTSSSFKKRIEIYAKLRLFEVAYYASDFNKSDEVPRMAKKIQEAFS